MPPCGPTLRQLVRVFSASPPISAREAASVDERLDRAEGRRLYGTDPTTYALGRPGYPERVYELLGSRCGLDHGSRVVEIGPGTGAVTDHLIARGAHVTAIEPNPALAAHLRRTFASSNLETVEEGFEDADLPLHAYDLAVAATSFHWVEQPAGMRQLRRVLRPGGWLAIWWMLFDDPENPDDLTRVVEARLGPSPGAVPSTGGAPFQLDTVTRTAELIAAGFLDATADIIHTSHNLDAPAARALYASMAIVLRLPVDEQQDVLNMVEAVVRDQFGGRLQRRMVTALYTARNP